MTNWQNPEVIEARIAQLQPPEGFASPPPIERAHVYYQRKREESFLPSAWTAGHVELDLDHRERPPHLRDDALAAARSTRAGDLLLVEAVGPPAPKRGTQPLRWLLVARLAAGMTVEDGMARAPVDRRRVFSHLPPETLPVGVADALSLSASTWRLVTLDVVLHPSLAPPRA